MKHILLALAAVSAMAAAPVEDPQGYRPGSAVPQGQMPPPGSCRAWLPGVAPGRQPPPTSCPAAQREANRYGGQVIWGGREDWRGDERQADEARAQPSQRARRDGDREVCVQRDWYGRCIRTERRR